jgi:hypothetical protein
VNTYLRRGTFAEGGRNYCATPNKDLIDYYLSLIHEAEAAVGLLNGSAGVVSEPPEPTGEIQELPRVDFDKHRDSESLGAGPPLPSATREPGARSPQAIYSHAQPLVRQVARLEDEVYQISANVDEIKKAIVALNLLETTLTKLENLIIVLRSVERKRDELQDRLIQRALAVNSYD